MENLWIDKLPRYLVLDSDALKFCLTEFSSELWSDEDFARISELAVQHHPVRWTGQDLRDHWNMMRRLLRKPWWNRREVLRDQWPDDAQLRLSLQLLTAHENAKGHPLHRATSRRWQRWVEGRTTPTKDTHQSSCEICGVLSTTRGYCEWVALGGDPDLGRYLGLYHERFALRKEFVLYDPDESLENEPQ